MRTKRAAYKTVSRGREYKKNTPIKMQNKNIPASIGIRLDFKYEIKMFLKSFISVYQITHSFFGFNEIIKA